MTEFDGRIALGLLRAGLDDPAFCDAMEANAGMTGARLPQVVLDRAIARGELPAGADPFAYEETVGAVLIMRVTNRQPVDDAYLAQLVDDMLIPALGHRPTAPGQASAALFSGSGHDKPAPPSRAAPEEP